MVHDLRQSVRHLSRQPVFALVAIVSLAVGIGVSTAAFSVFDALLFRPPALMDLERAVVVYHRSPGNANQGTSFRAFAQYRQRTDILAKSMAVTGARPLVLTDGDRRDQVYGEPVTSGFFSMATIRLRLGAPFTADVDNAPGSPVIVLSHGFWTRRFNGDASIVGTSITLNGEPFTVTGVAEEGFDGFGAEVRTDLWIPLTTWAQLAGEPGRLTSDEHWLTTIAELAPGVSLEQARSALRIAGQALDPPAGQETAVQYASEGLFEIPTDAIVIIAGVFGLALIVLALACTNVANLLMARAAARQHEMAVRLALGSGRWRLVWLWISESLVLSVSAAALGLVLASWLLATVPGISVPLEIGEAAPPALPLQFALNLRVFAFAFGLASIAAVVVGWVAGLQSSRGLMTAGMNASRASGRRFAPGFNVRSGVIALQMALCTVLLIPCGLFVRSARAAVGVDPGFDASHVLLLPISANQAGVKVNKPEGFDRDLAERVRRLPGVIAATVMDPVPLWFAGRNAHYRTPEHGVHPLAHASVGLQYFTTMRIPLIMGRDFDAGDTASSPAVAIVSDTMAREFWPGGHVIGQRIHDGEESIEVIGVARDAKYRSLSERPQAFVYRPITQMPSSNIALSLAVRTQGDPAAFQDAIRREVQSLVPGWPGFQFRRLDEGLQVQQALPRLAAALLGGLGSFGLFLATLGIYGVVACVVRQRRQELCIRLALGAPVARVVALVVRQGMVLCVIGTVVAIPIAWGLARIASSVLAGVGSADIVTCLAVPLGLLAVALIACYLPAREVARIDRALYRAIQRP